MIQDQWNIMFDVSTLYIFSSHEKNSVSKQNITNSLVGAAYIFIYNIILTKQPPDQTLNQQTKSKQQAHEK